MIIEVIGIGAPNKGAELMLVALQEQIKQHYPQAQFVLEPYTKYEHRAKHQCLQKAWFTFKDIQVGDVFALMPKKLRNKFGIVLDSEIDVILDASGFAYGDQWGAKKVHNRLSRYLPKWKKSGKKVILLPQALGPFSEPDIQSNMKSVIEQADAIYARDDVSFKYANALSPNKVKQAPDFTNLCEGILPYDLTGKELDVCVIPNAKMIEMTSSDVGSGYVDSLIQAVKLLQSHGRTPYLLVHEGKGDKEIAEQINAALDTPLEMLEYDDPKHIKGIIGHSRLVVSSRFHGLVSSLSQGVPCIATGWSHKYQMLMDDYQCGDLLVEQGEAMSDKLAIILDESHYQNYQSRIRQCAAEQKQRTKLMWEDVFQLLRA